MAVIAPFRALRPDACIGGRRCRRSVRRRQHRRSARAGGRQSAELSARLARGDRPAARHESVRRCGVREGRRELRGAEGAGAARPRGRAEPVRVPPADGRARADRHRRLLFGGRVRPRRHQEARTHAAGQGRRPDASHLELRAQTGPGVPDVPRVAGVDAVVQRTTATAPLFDFTRRRRRAAHGLAGCGEPTSASWSRRLARFRRCTSPTAITAPPAPRARGSSSAARAAPPASGTRSSPSRFPATRCRSCRTTGS